MKFIRFAIPALICLIAWSCSERNEDPVPAPGTSTSYLRLALSVAGHSQSRVGPAAGEDGDGREDGVNKENDIDNIAIFIYEDNGAGLDSDAATPLLAKSYATRLNMTEENGILVCTLPLGNYNPSSKHRAVVVANAGDITDEINTLGELRTRPAINAWTPAANIAETKGFLMASAYNGAKRPSDNDGHIRVLHNGNGTAKNPNFATSVAIERAAARIDIMYGSPDMPCTSGLYYHVKSAQNSKLIITHILPVNLMKEPSYTLKHLTMSTTNLDLLVCADETTDAAGNAANYIVTPSTFAMGEDTAPSSITKWFGKSEAAYIRSNPSTIVDEGIAIARATDITIPQPIDGYTQYRIIGYANENTQLPEAQDSRFISGLALRAIYRPAKIYRDADLSDFFQGDIDGTTFWLLRPTEQEMGEDNCIYFASETAAIEYQKQHPELLATIEYFPGGICYYNLWLRHAGELCAIVRNNIYRVAFSFTGPGHPTPELTEPHNIESRIFVRRWNFRPQSEILM